MRPEDQPDPVTFCAPLDLDGDPPPRQLTPRILVAALVFVVVALIVATLEGCAPSLQGKRWSPPTVTVALDPSAPECAEWAVSEAWKLLKPGRPLTIRRGGAFGYGDIAVIWGLPLDYPRTLAVTYPLGDRKEWAKSRSIVRAVVVANQCNPRLLGHELGHALGLPHAESGLMAPIFEFGDYSLSRRQRRALR